MSTVILDTITGKSTATTITIGSTPVVSASANSMTIRGEGSAQTSIQQGLAKAWINYNTRTSTSISDSFSISSISDGGTGYTTINFTNAMANANFCQTMGMGDEGTTWTTSHAMAATNNSAKTTGQTKFHTGGQNAATASDLYENNVMIAGDLA